MDEKEKKYVSGMLKSDPDIPDEFKYKSAFETWKREGPYKHNALSMLTVELDVGIASGKA